MPRNEIRMKKQVLDKQKDRETDLCFLANLNFITVAFYYGYGCYLFHSIVVCLVRKLREKVLYIKESIR